MKAAMSWAPQEITRFYRGFLKYGTEFDKVSKSVGGGKSPDMCDALYRQHKAYLSLEKKFQSEVAFVAMVQDAFNHFKEDDSPSKAAGSGEGGEPERGQRDEDDAMMGASSGAVLALAGGDAKAVSEGATARGSRGRIGGVEHEEEEEGPMDGEATEEDSLGGGGGRESVPASTRPRRTPKRSVLRTPPGARSARRTPQSSAKRLRSSLRDDDIYEYYDPAMEAITESARKRRASQKRLDFHHHAAAAGMAGAAGGRRREAADEAKGIDALLSLAVAGEEFEDGEEGEEEVGKASLTEEGGRREEEEEAEEEEVATEEEGDEEEEEGGEGEEGGEDEDEDYSEAAAPLRRRRTPISTPLRARSRPGSAHVTPRRTALRGVASPGLRGLGSPAWLGLSDTELGMGELGIPDLSYLSSPGFTPSLPPGYVPSPKNPMPRLRRRKYAPTKSPPVVSPFKSLFGSRRQSLVGGPPAPQLLQAYGASYGSAGAGGGGEEGVVIAAMEVQLRHCLNARVRRWCQFEFFYSAIDRPWFMQSAPQALLAHLGLGGLSRLTRREWGLLRAGLGKPRRLSLHFLREERVRLEAWRESVRAHYAATGAAGAPPVDPAVVASFPRALNVGQRVTARHPTTRQIHDGSVLTAAPNMYRIQFDRRELGVEMVQDYEIMPADPAENLPPVMLATHPLLLLNGRYIVGGQPMRPPAPRAIFPLTFSSIPAVAPAAAAYQRTPQQQQQLMLQQPQTVMLATQQTQQQQHSQPSLQQGTPPEAPGSTAAAPAAVVAPAPNSAQRAAASAAEAQALSELAVNLDKKEALLVQLRAMNDEAAAGVHAVRCGAAGGSGGGGDTSQAFKLAYAKVVLQLRDTNERVAGKLVELEALRSAAPAASQEAGAPGEAAQVLAAPPGPETADSLAAAALQEARTMVAGCRRKLAEAAAEAARRTEAGEPLPPHVPGALGQVTEAIDWELPSGRLLGGVIEGCVWSLLALQRGCSAPAPTPAATLAGALDTALQAVRPHAAANQQLYTDIRQAMDALRAQLLVA